ncbi:hypothetical protein BD779DRAFT_733386 [Infundibulicybe gibba]|nr:hypothetical protein BD779DRAFT_733386 [Infundibulicybe gibba]
MQQNFMIAGDPLSLDRIRSVLTRLEDTIIFSLIERAQFAHNPRIYQRGSFQELKDLDFQGSWLEWFLKETETFHGERKLPVRIKPNISCQKQKPGATLGTFYVSQVSSSIFITHYFQSG